MTKRFDNFDYLRIIGSVLIVFYHYEMAYKAKFGHDLMFYGTSLKVQYVVELFFILSGFLTAVRKNNKRFFSAMLVKWLRIYPIALLSVLVSLLGLILRVLVSPLSLSDYPAGNIVASLLLVHQGWVVTYDSAINTPTWYLCVLLLCYMIYYLIDSLDRRVPLGNVRNVIYVAIMMVAIAAQGHELPFLKLKSCRGYLGFFAGVIICEAFKVVSSRRLIFYGIALALSGIALVFVSRVSFLWESLASVIMFSGIVMITGSIRQYPHRIAKRLGAASFEVYLFHVPIIELSSILVYISRVSYTRSIVTMVVLLILVEILALWINKYIEIPLGRKITKKLDKHKLIMYHKGSGS